MQHVKYPVEVQLTGKDGNAFAIMKSVNVALEQHGVPLMERTAWLEEAMQSSSYEALLLFVMATVDVK